MQRLLSNLHLLRDRFLAVIHKLASDQSKKTEEIKKIKQIKEIKEKCERLEGRFYGSMKFLRKTFLQKNGKNINLSHLPWYIVIGTPSSGKTTLLANSTIKFTLSKQFQPEQLLKLPPSQTCDWWVTRDLVLVDVPGSYFTQSVFLWEHFLRCLFKIRKKNTLSGVILTVNLPEWMQSSDQQKKIDKMLQLKKQLADIHSLFGKYFPIQFVITKCDLLPGFSEFFSESSSEEAAQAWGITLPSPHEKNEKPHILANFAEQFNALIKNINKQLIFHLHQEKNALARFKIKEFPLQLERLKEEILYFLKLLGQPAFPLYSVYLTSGTQTHSSLINTNSLAGSLLSQETFSASPTLWVAPSQTIRPYFIRQLILQHLVAMPIYNIDYNIDITEKKNHLLEKKIAYAAAIGTGLVAVLLLGRSFQYSMAQASAVQRNLTQYELNVQQFNPQSQHLLLALTLLNKLHEIANETPTSWLLTIYTNKSKKIATIIYRQALQTILLPEIKKYFEKYLQETDVNKNAEEVYKILAAYVMLENSEYFQENFITHTLEKLLARSIHRNVNDTNKNINIIAALAEHLGAAYASHEIPTALNKNLIQQVRKQLLNLPHSTLGLAILKNIDSSGRDIEIPFGNPPIFTSKLTGTRIPYLFTADAFHHVMTDEMTSAASAVLQGNWVLGNTANLAGQAAIDALASELRTQYISRYVGLWENVLANIQLTVPQDLEQLDNHITVLISRNSPLLQLLDMIKIHAQMAPITAASPKLQNLSLLLAQANNNSSNSLYKIFAGLERLHQYLQLMLQARQAGAPVFHAALERAQHVKDDPILAIHLIAEQNPEPMKTWLNTLAIQSRYFIFQTDPLALRSRSS